MIVLTAARGGRGLPGDTFRPDFLELAIAIIFGTIAATALTLLAVPLLYHEFFKNRVRPLKAEESELSGENGRSRWEEDLCYFVPDIHGKVLPQGMVNRAILLLSK
jgi:hypothetical protein